MKKIIACFLVMVLAVGCAQAPVEPEKPVKPPVIEEPQKPEQVKPEEEIDLSKIISFTIEPVEIELDVERYKDQLFIQEPI